MSGLIDIFGNMIDILSGLILFAGLSFSPAMLLAFFDELNIVDLEDMFFISWMVSVILNVILFFNGGY
jgi:hypothetical protein